MMVEVRILAVVQVIDDQICFRWDDRDLLRNIFRDREDFYKKIYHHRCDPM